MSSNEGKKWKKSNEKSASTNGNFKGSRFRCLLATQQPKASVIAFLNSLVQPSAKVNRNDWYMPEGFSKSAEARLGETSGFLTTEQRELVTLCWLAVRQNANTPNWDLVSLCTIGPHKGLVLVEAKAHAGELNQHDCCGAENEQNRRRIESAIRDVSRNLGEGWVLSIDSRYQLSNRFAWAWKVASLGVPVVLVYLGFLNADEMSRPFTNHGDWEDCLLTYAEGTVPRRAWISNQMKVNDTSLFSVIRSADVNVRTSQF